ncbi:fluoride efflux transporter FluC [Herbiconiux ginsengi]|uniref:Fluoride-specific ion channel FluC n=1 Tax=Herbiconiux ginsengi TaxID=381665 RepID=A0A1H3T001_9MICO|nr:CrcB family protein [Herbiconiux ginsengi]SDZ43562.1 CrcB protein [Herbiconiux ginsengi]
MTSVTGLTVFAIAVAGGLGAVARLVVGGAVQHWSRWKFPIGTAVLNVTGSFFLGLVMSAAATSLAPTWLAIVGTGFLGGFTTFSTASVDTADLVRGRLWGQAALNAGVTGLLSIAAAGLGYSL